MNELNTPEELLARCVALAEDKKGRDIVSLKMSGLTLVCDYFLLVTAANTRQAQSISDNIEMGLKEDGLQPNSINLKIPPPKKKDLKKKGQKRKQLYL